MDDIILTVKQAAAELAVSPRTIQLWIQEGQLPNAYKLNPINPRNSPYRIPRTDIVKLRDQRLAGNPN